MVEPAGWLSDSAVLDFAAVLTLVLLLLHTEGTLRWFLVPAIIAGAASRGIRLHPALWATVGGVRLVAHIPFAWYAIDNHQYLLTYWCLTLALALAGPQALKVLRTNARLLVGLAFAFAALWKVISPDFLDGSLFHYILVAEDRITTLSGPLLGIEPAPGEDLEAIVSIGLGYASPETVVVPYRGDVGAAPQLLAWLTVFIELAVAATFLVPLRGRVWFRDVVLLLFLWTTYLVTPVIGFGMTLAAMGYVQAHGAGWRRGYLVTFAALPLFVAVTAVPLFPPGFLIALVGAVVLVVYLVWSARPVLIVGCAVLGAGLAAVSVASPLHPMMLVGAGLGLGAVVLLDVAGKRPFRPHLALVGSVLVVIGALASLV